MQHASYLHSVDGCSNGVVFHAMQLEVHSRPRCMDRADGHRLASQTISVAMRYAAHAVDVVLSDVTPREGEPTMYLRVHAEDQDPFEEERWDLVEFRALCPADLEHATVRILYATRLKPLSAAARPTPSHPLCGDPLEGGLAARRRSPSFAALRLSACFV